MTENFCGVADDNGNPQTGSICYWPNEDEDGNPIAVELPPQAPQGTQLPVTPEFKANATARYEFPLAGFDSWVQGSVHLFGRAAASDLRLEQNAILGNMPSYTIADFSVGLARDSWRLELYVQNAFDELAQVGRYAQCIESVCGSQLYVTPQRPRFVGAEVLAGVLVGSTREARVTGAGRQRPALFRSSEPEGEARAPGARRLDEHIGVGAELAGGRRRQHRLVLDVLDPQARAPAVVRRVVGHRGVGLEVVLLLGAAELRERAPERILVARLDARQQPARAERQFMLVAGRDGPLRRVLQRIAAEIAIRECRC